MSIYFIEDPNGIIYELDASADITYTIAGKVTSNPLEDGETAADNYVNSPRRVSIRGSISDVKSVSSGGVSSKSTFDFITGLEKLKVNKEFVTFHFGTKVGVITSCLFEKVEFKQTKERGNIKDIDSFSVSIVLKQARIATRALLVPLRDPTVSDDFATKGAGSKSTETPNTADRTLMDQVATLTKPRT